MKILEHHEGGFWTLSRTARQTDSSTDSTEGTGPQFVKTRISNAIFNNEIPAPRDVIIICLINTCDVLRFMFQLDDDAEQRIEFICKMDLIGRSISAAVSHYFKLEVSPSNYKLGFSPLPSMKPNKKLKFRIAEQRRELHA